MKSRLEFFVLKIKSYWRLFFQRMPILRNATGIALIIFCVLYFVRFEAPLNFQFPETGSKFHFIQKSNLGDLYSSNASLELFDTAPIFIPTQWNYGSTVLPEKRIISDTEFVSFQPLIESHEFTNLNRMKLNYETPYYGIIYENTFFDPRLLALFTPSLFSLEKGFLNNRVFSVEIIESCDKTELPEGAILEYAYELNEGTVWSNLEPVIIFLRNENPLVAKPRVYQSSLSELFDEQILEWLNQPKHIALLPKGFLKLTFYPN